MPVMSTASGSSWTSAELFFLNGGHRHGSLDPGINGQPRQLCVSIDLSMLQLHNLRGCNIQFKGDSGTVWTWPVIRNTRSHRPPLPFSHPAPPDWVPSVNPPWTRFIVHGLVLVWWILRLAFYNQARPPVYSSVVLARRRCSLGQHIPALEPILSYQIISFSVTAFWQTFLVRMNYLR